MLLYTKTNVLYARMSFGDRRLLPLSQGLYRSKSHWGYFVGHIWMEAHFSGIMNYFDIIQDFFGLNNFLCHLWNNTLSLGLLWLEVISKVFWTYLTLFRTFMDNFRIIHGKTLFLPFMARGPLLGLLRSEATLWVNSICNSILCLEPLLWPKYYPIWSNEMSCFSTSGRPFRFLAKHLVLTRLPFTW